MFCKSINKCLVEIAECSLDSFLLTGMVEQAVLEYIGFEAGEATIDEKAEVLFLGQLYGSNLLFLYVKSPDIAIQYLDDLQVLNAIM